MKVTNKSNSTAGKKLLATRSKSTKKYSKIKVALVYDRVNKWGGAERLLLSLKKAFPQADLFTLVYNPATAPWAKKFKVQPSFFNQIPFFRTRHELLAPVSALGFESFNFDKFDLVISVTSDTAKAIKVNSPTVHLCYCLTPTRYLWSGVKDYQNLCLNYLKSFLQKRDLVYATRPDAYLSISKTVQKRVKKYYHRDSEVVYPPINYHFWSKFPSKLARPAAAVEGKARSAKGVSDSYLVVSRLVPYKKVDLVIRAFKQLQGESLKVVGTGSELKKLKKIAPTNVEFLGAVSDQKLHSLYQTSKALIFPQDEDFGLVPLEAMSAGLPVIAFRSGGATETILENKTGLFFNRQNVSSLTKAILKFEKMKFNSKTCQKQASRYDETTFIKNFRQKVRQYYETNRHSRRTR
jgi:glycosyltransferase involved in cell wall biosynthesis